MTDHIYNKIVICDCIGCGNRPSIKQIFTTKKGLVKVDLCKPHYFILRTKVPKNIPLNEDVLKWLLIQDPDPNKAPKYGIIRGLYDTEIIKELKKIELDYD